MWPGRSSPSTTEVSSGRTDSQSLCALSPDGPQDFLGAEGPLSWAERSHTRGFKALQDGNPLVCPLILERRPPVGWAQMASSVGSERAPLTNCGRWLSIGGKAGGKPSWRRSWSWGLGRAAPAWSPCPASLQGSTSCDFLWPPVLRRARRYQAPDKRRPTVEPGIAPPPMLARPGLPGLR